MAQPFADAPSESLEYPVADERRGADRHASKLHARCCPVQRAVGAKAAETLPVVNAKVRDLSSFGAALLLPYEPAVGALLEVELTSRNYTVSRVVLARVVHVTPEGTKKAWLAGCAFITELTQEGLRLFQAEAVPSEGDKSRRWTRFPCNVETVCYTSETAPGERRGGRVLNISAGGVALLLRCEFSTGTLLYFEPPATGLEPSQPLLVRVVRAAEHTPGNWLLGCEFADHISEDELGELLA